MFGANGSELDDAYASNIARLHNRVVLRRSLTMRWWRDDADLDADCHCLEPRVRSKFAEKSLDMISHGHGTDMERGGNLFRRMARREMLEHDALSRTQRTTSRGTLAAAVAPFLCVVGRDRCSRCDRANRGEQVTSSSVLRYDTRAPGVPGGGQGRLVAQPGHDEHAGARGDVSELRDAGRGVAVGKPVVEEHDVGCVRRGRLDATGDGIRDRDDDQVRLVAQEADQTVDEHAVVVDDHDACRPGPHVLCGHVLPISSRRTRSGDGDQHAAFTLTIGYRAAT